MSLTIIPFNNPKLTVATTEAGLATGDAYECQLTQAELQATANLQEVPQTGCAPASQIPGRDSWALVLAWLQDWTAPGGGFSNFCKINSTTEVWFSLAIDIVGDPTVVATGHGWVAGGSYGGVIGGPPLAATATWPLIEEPDIVVPAALPLTADEPVADAELLDA